MKKFVGIFSTLLLVISLLLPQIALANENNQNDWQDVSLSKTEFENILSNNNENISTCSDDLIKKTAISVAKSGTKLIIVGVTTCSDSVVKCGFKEVIIQRRKNSSSSWSNYKTYDDLYADSYIYRLSKSIAVASGYQYRVTCTHYAKKNLFSTQKIDNVSNVVTI